MPPIMAYSNSLNGDLICCEMSFETSEGQGLSPEEFLIEQILVQKIHHPGSLVLVVIFGKPSMDPLTNGIVNYLYILVYILHT